MRSFVTSVLSKIQNALHTITICIPYYYIGRYAVVQVENPGMIIKSKPEMNLKARLGIKKPRASRVDLVITCTFTDRWVASNPLYRFQHPAADCSREACEPRIDPASLITKCGLKKDLSRTPQGSAAQAAHVSLPDGNDSAALLLRPFPKGPLRLPSEYFVVFS